ncbi:hypothetical protein [Legionella birminghamensis]|nr:hypothetical protein [Legionella birminghamensis]
MMDEALPIWQMAYNTVRTILQMLEPFYPGALDKVFATETPHIQLRFLRYYWQKSGKYLAKPHFDAGSFTLAIAESSPGLRIGRDPETLDEVIRKEGHAIFMVSSNYKNIINSDELFPGWHDVIQVHDETIGQPFARWALVVFIEAHGVKALPRTETHRWYTSAE